MNAAKRKIEDTIMQMFDQASEHLLKQNEKSIDEFGECTYRGMGGTKCAIGALISDQYYSPDFKGHNVQRLEIRRAVLLSFGICMFFGETNALSRIDKEHYGFRIRELLEQLQFTHDCYEPDMWPDKLAALKINLLKLRQMNAERKEA